VSTHSARLLSIGEFAAATQLSPKALRIYDDQQLLVPARIDATTGYRFYRSDQVAVGRLIRTLREMGLSLTAIATVVASRENGADLVLHELAHELEQRYARERRAYHAALLLLQDAPRATRPEVIERPRTDTAVVVQPFLASRYDFVEKFRAQAHSTREAIVQAGLTSQDRPSCCLIDPLSDDDGRLEVVIAVQMPAKVPNGLTLRVLPAAPCAVIATKARHTHASDLAAALDVLFDWFDRRGCRAIETPLVSIEADDNGLRTEISWAFERIAG
jgi:DNA-binding transcriptional MerR regulator